MVCQEKSSDTDSRSLRLKVKFPKLGKKKPEEEDRPKSGQGIQGFIGKFPWQTQRSWRCPPSSLGTSQGPEAPIRNAHGDGGDGGGGQLGANLRWSQVVSWTRCVLESDRDTDRKRTFEATLLCGRCDRNSRREKWEQVVTFLLDPFLSLVDKVWQNSPT